MRRFVCCGCGEVWYCAALLDRPCEACGGNLRETAEETGERGDDEERRPEFPGRVTAGEVGRGGAAAAQPGGEAAMRTDAGGKVPAGVPGQPERLPGGRQG